MSNDTSCARILHLSDFHFRADSDSSPVLGELARFLADEVSRGLAPDLVVITGDLAFTGKPKEYELAETWLQELWPDLSVGSSDALPRDRLLLVPGNQDADPERVSRGARSMQDGLLEEGSQDAIAEMLEDRDDRTSLLERHTAYQKFYAHWLSQPQPLPWWQRAIDIRGLVTGTPDAHSFPIEELYIELKASGTRLPIAAPSPTGSSSSRTPRNRTPARSCPTARTGSRTFWRQRPRTRARTSRRRIFGAGCAAVRPWCCSTAWTRRPIACSANGSSV